MEQITVRDLGAGIEGGGVAGPALKAWRAFVGETEGATFFHRPEWAGLISETYGYDAYYRCAWRGKKLVGVLPLHHVKTPLFGNALISTAFFVYGGILAADDAAAQILAQDAAALAERLGVDYLELRSEVPQIIGWPSKSDIYATFRAPILTDEEEALKAIPRKKRADVRKGIKAALPVETGTSLDVFYRLYAQNLRNLGSPIHAKRWYKSMQEHFGDDVEISAVHGPDGPVAALMTFYFKDQVLPYYAGSVPEARRLHAYDYMYWSLMRRAAERGYHAFDFGRSKFGTGAFDYKTYWGFEPQALHYQYHLCRAKELPDINPNNPKYRTFVKGWQKLPLWGANLLGPLLARQLG